MLDILSGIAIFAILGLFGLAALVDKHAILNATMKRDWQRSDQR